MSVTVSARVLIVDDEVNLRFAIERGLRKAGHHADSSSTVKQAMERVRQQAYDIVITDLQMPGGDGTALAEWLASYSPSTRVLVVSAFVTDEIRERYHGKNGMQVLEKPVELESLLQIVSSIGARRGFYGNSIEVELFDYVQMVALSGRDKLIEVQTHRGQGTVWFEHGDIVHCAFENQTGEDAFYRMLSAKSGTFKEVFFQEPPTRTIIGSSTHLLMEAARRMDEGILEGPAGGTSEGEASETSFADVLPAAPSGLPADDDDDIDNDLILPADDDDDDAIVPVVDIPEPTVSLPDPSASSSGISMFDDPEMRAIMLGQFFEYEGVNGAAIISSTGKVLAEDMRSNAALVTLAGFYMRGAARIARDLGHNVFDGVVAKAVTGQQLLLVGMGATSAVLSVEIGCDPETIRREIMGDEA